MNETAKFSLFDKNGAQTGTPFTKKILISAVITVLVYIGISMLPMQAYGENCAKGLAFLVASILFMVTSSLDVSIIGMLMITIAPLLGLCTWQEVQAASGSSSLYPMLGMTIVALGCEFTPFGKRISYWFLYTFGHKPVRMLLAVGISSSLLSAFVSNTAVIILMSSIINLMLLAMGEKPGESRLGKAAMLIVLIAAMYGGIALINGSPGSNNLLINFMNSASGDLDLTIPYAHWAKTGFPIYVITFVPVCFIYIKWFKIKNTGFDLLPKSYYKEKLNELGKMAGSEWRWVIITVAMVVCMLAGMNSNLAAMLFAAITLLPLIGVSPWKEVAKKVPWSLLVALITIPILGTIINTSGITVWLQEVISPLLSGMGLLGFSIALALLAFLMVNLLVNANFGVWAFVGTVGTAISISLGYNPVVAVFPAFLTSAMMWCFGGNVIVMLNKSYNWWEMKDPVAPGLIAGLFISIAIPLLNYLLNMLFGTPMYL